ncbi:MAG: HD domain-containing protein [Peptococcaceae bacterium]|nr:HD domain-containing protein [Peptococcaceae bacterium]
MEISLRSNSGESIPVHVYVNHVKDIVGDNVGILLVGQDLRLTKKLEKEISERLRTEAVLFKANSARSSIIKTLTKTLQAQELTPIAEWILKHHEWWNGSGYPLCLKENDIPLECRILAIADAYIRVKMFP